MPFVDKHIELTGKDNPFIQDQSLTEIYKFGVQYAIVSPNGEYCTSWMFCKDYLQDVFYHTIHKKDYYFSIYGFEWNPKKHPVPDASAIRIAIRNDMLTGSQFKQNAVGLADFMNQIEDIMGISKTIVAPIYQESAYYAQSGIRWLRHPAMLSLYSLLLRAGLCHKSGDNWRDTINKILGGEIRSQKNDTAHMSVAARVIDAIVYSGGGIFSPSASRNWGSSALGISDIHDSSGVCNFVDSYDTYSRSFGKLRDPDGCPGIVVKPDERGRLCSVLDDSITKGIQPLNIVTDMPLSQAMENDDDDWDDDDDLDEDDIDDEAPCGMEVGQ